METSRPLWQAQYKPHHSQTLHSNTAVATMKFSKKKIYRIWHTSVYWIRPQIEIYNYNSAITHRQKAHILTQLDMYSFILNKKKIGYITILLTHSHQLTLHILIVKKCYVIWWFVFRPPSTSWSAGTSKLFVDFHITTGSILCWVCGYNFRCCDRKNEYKAKSLPVSVGHKTKLPHMQIASL